MSLSPDQLAIRAGRMSGTDVAAASGCHPHRGPLDVFLEKTGQAPPFVETVRSRWGHKLEPMIREDYEEQHNVNVEDHGTIIHPRHDWACVTPDGLVYPRGSRLPERGLEIKVHGRDAVVFGNLVYGAQGTDEVPLHELVQATWGMACTELDRWDLVPFLDGAPLEYTIERDDELIDMLTDRSARLMVDHIRKNEPPPPDGSIAWDNWLKRRWEKNSEDLIDIDQIPELLALVADLRLHREQSADLELATDRIVQRVKKEIGDKAGLSWTDPAHPKAAKMRKPPRSQVTWKHSASSVQDDWKATVNAMRTDAALIASSRSAEVIEALDALHLAGNEPIGTGVPALKIFELVEAMSVSLSALATYANVKKTVSSGRPFNVPRWWKATKPEPKKPGSDSDETDNTEEN